MPTIRDVAAQLGVDPSTVSRALNGDYQLSSDLTEIIAATAKEMGYSLRGRGGRATPDWNVSGIIVPSIDAFPYSQIVHLAQEQFCALRYNTMVKVSGDSQQEILDAIDTMRDIPARCILIALGNECVLSEETIQYILDCEIPVALLSSCDYSGSGVDSVCFDDPAGMYLAVQHLLSRGYKRLSFIGETKRQSELFREALNMHFVSASTHFIRIGNADGEDIGYLQMKKMLRLKKRPDAVICASA